VNYGYAGETAQAQAVSQISSCSGRAIAVSSSVGKFQDVERLFNEVDGAISANPRYGGFTWRHHARSFRLPGDVASFDR